MSGYLRVSNWEKHQHYKAAAGDPRQGHHRRRLVWVKYMLDELDDDVFLRLSYPTQLLFHRLLLLEAKAVNRGGRGFTDDPATLASKVGIDVDAVTVGLNELTGGGWLTPSQTQRASKMLAGRSESEAEVKPERTRNERSANEQRNRNEHGDNPHQPSQPSQKPANKSASKPLANRYQNATVEVEVEKEKDLKIFRDGEKPRCPESTCNLPFDTHTRIRAHLANVHWWTDEQADDWLTQKRPAT